jgi:hypothetical protein
MVGIFKKIKQILQFVQNNASLANYLVPGLGPFINSVGALGENITDRAETVYNKYQETRKSDKKFSIKDGIETFFTNTPPDKPQEPVKLFSKPYGELHPRIRLKNN